MYHTSNVPWFKWLLGDKKGTWWKPLCLASADFSTSVWQQINNYYKQTNGQGIGQLGKCWWAWEENCITWPSQEKNAAAQRNKKHLEEKLSARPPETSLIFKYEMIHWRLFDGRSLLGSLLLPKQMIFFSYWKGGGVITNQILSFRLTKTRGKRTHIQITKKHWFW